MSAAPPCSLGFIPVCSQAGLRLAVFSAGRTKRAKMAEGKIKETGTMGRRFQGKPLSAHCFGAALAAPSFWTPRAASRRKALALQGFDRHHSPKSGGLPGFGPEVRP